MIPFILTEQSLTVVLDNNTLTMQRDNPTFENAKLALVEERYDDLKNLFDTEKAVVAFAEGNIQVSEGQVFYAGEPVHSHVVDRVLNFMKEGLPHKPLLRFLDKLMSNPSRRAVQELYTFLEHKKMPLTPDGNFLAYKSVRHDWTDHHTGRFTNVIGTSHSMVRNAVCDNANIGCSDGFHAGSLEYAKTFGSSDSRLLIVEIDPSDVVSVPLDCSCQKLRTSKYKVVAEFVRPLDEPLNSDYSDKGYDDKGYEGEEGEEGEEGLGASSDDELSKYYVGHPKYYGKPFVSEATRAKLRANALAQKRVDGKFVK